MRLVIEVKATPDQADDWVEAAMRYLREIEGAEIVNYWVEES